MLTNLLRQIAGQRLPVVGGEASRGRRKPLAGHAHTLTHGHTYCGDGFTGVNMSTLTKLLLKHM